MALFAVLLPYANPTVIASIEEKFPDPNHFKINSTQWVVSGKGTAQKISDLLGTTENGGVVLSFSGYWGRADANLWEWMKAKIEESDNG